MLIANQIYKTNNVIKYLGSGYTNRPTSSHSAITARGLPSVTISMALTKAFLREALTTKQMRVEIYEPAEGAAGRKNNTIWELAKEASPGNIAPLEDLLFEKDDLVANAVSMAIKVIVKDGMRIVGCAFIDVQEKTVGVAQYEETENFSNTEVSFDVPRYRLGIACLIISVLVDPIGDQRMLDTSGRQTSRSRIIKTQDVGRQV